MNSEKNDEQRRRTRVTKPGSRHEVAFDPVIFEQRLRQCSCVDLHVCDDACSTTTRAPNPTPEDIHGLLEAESKVSHL